MRVPMLRSNSSKPTIHFFANFKYICYFWVCSGFGGWHLQFPSCLATARPLRLKEDLLPPIFSSFHHLQSCIAWIRSQAGDSALARGQLWLLIRTPLFYEVSNFPHAPAMSFLYLIASALSPAYCPSWGCLLSGVGIPDTKILFWIRYSKSGLILTA